MDKTDVKELLEYEGAKVIGPSLAFLSRLRSPQPRDARPCPCRKPIFQEAKTPMKR
jgi:hypothetical protein